MQGNYFHCKEGYNQKRLVEWMGEQLSLVMQGGGVPCVKVEPYRNPRSLSANALMWMWFEEMAKIMNARGLQIEYYHDDGTLKGMRPWNKDDAHDLMVKKYLGVEKKKMGQTYIENLEKTSRLDSGEFCIFLEKVYQFMVKYFDHFLPDPADSQFREWKDRQND